MVKTILNTVTSTTNGDERRARLAALIDQPEAIENVL
jgi:hypothetical protein